MGDTNLILLTAAVTPDPRFGSAVSDPAERLAEYQRAVRRWQAAAKTVGFNLAVVETTGSDALASEANLISYAPTESEVSRGKGSAESAALDYAMSVLAPSRETTVVKVTGRLIVANAARLLNPVMPNTARVRRTLDRRYCDSRFFLITAGFWADHLRGMGKDVDDRAGRYLEHVLAHRLVLAEFLERAKVGSFPNRPLIVGQSGADGKRYGTAMDRVKEPLLGPAEQLLRRLASKQI